MPALIVKSGCEAGDASGSDGESCCVGGVSTEVFAAAAVEADRVVREKGRDNATRHERQTCDDEAREEDCATRYIALARVLLVHRRTLEQCRSYKLMLRLCAGNLSSEETSLQMFDSQYCCCQRWIVLFFQCRSMR